jgi:hypothetical protein
MTQIRDNAFVVTPREETRPQFLQITCEPA